MIFSENRFPLFPDHALGALFESYRREKLLLAHPTLARTGVASATNSIADAIAILRMQSISTRSFTRRNFPATEGQ